MKGFRSDHIVETAVLVLFGFQHGVRLLHNLIDRYIGIARLIGLSAGCVILAIAFYRRKRAVKMISIIALLIFSGGLLTACGREQSSTANDIFEEIVRRNPDAVISVGILENGQEEKYIYTADGREAFSDYMYQIGSITKTFTGAMIAYEESRGGLALSDGCPSMKHLVTHKSGLADQWEQELLINPEKIFKREEMYAMTDALKLTEGGFMYSNFGSALAGTRAAEIYGKHYGKENLSYQEAMNDFIVRELGLKETKVGGYGDFPDNWEWHEQDELMAAGAITSDVPDLLKYGQLYLDKDERYCYLKSAVSKQDSVDADYDIGFFWLIDRESGMIWHNGELAMDSDDGTEVGYQSFIGISPKKDKVVVILSNSICNAEDGTAYTDILGCLLMEQESNGKH